MCYLKKHVPPAGKADDLVRALEQLGISDWTLYQAAMDSREDLNGVFAYRAKND
jgi:hypothetical protein